MNNFPYSQGNSQNLPTFNSFEKYQSYIQLLQSNPPSFAVNPTEQTPNTQQFSSHNFSHYQYPNTEQYDAPTPNQGSSNRDWIPGEDEDEDNEEADAEEPILTPAVVRKTSGGSGASCKGKRAWSHREEEALIGCYMLHCTDQVMSTNQKSWQLWKKVFASYEAARASRPNELPERNLNMMQTHWRRMCKDVMKWVGCYEEAKGIKRSGEQQKNIIEVAKTIFHNQEGKKFAYEHAWEKLCEHGEKWKAKVERFTNLKGVDNNIGQGSGKESDSSGKRLRDGDDVSIDDVVSNKSVRPDGVKKAKAKAAQRKGKGVSSTSDDASTLLGERLQMFVDVKGSDMELRRQKLEFEKERARIRKEEMKHNILQTLLSKPPPLSAKEEKLKDKLFTELYGDMDD